MRANLDGPTSTLYTGGAYDTHIRLKVENGSGTFISLEGRYTKISLRQPDPKEPIGSMSIEIVRDITSEGVTASLSPLVEASDLNEDDGGAYSPLLQIGRQVTLDVNLTAVGGARPADGDSTWYEIFRGVIGRVDWPAHDKHLLTVDVDGLAAVLQHGKSEAEYTYTAGTSLETVVSEVLSNNGFGSVPTFFPAATGKVLPNDWEPGLQKTVWGQLVSIAQSMGWVVYYRYRGQNPAEVTVFEPARSKSVADHSVETDDFHAIAVDDAEVRNVGFLGYVDPDGIEQTLGPDVDSASLTKYGGTLSIRRPFFIKLDEDSPVRAETEAQAMLTAALSDVADPDVVATANTMPLVFAESGIDLYDIPARDRFFDTAQKWALFGNEINFAVDKEPRSSLGLRGVPTAGVKSWRDMTASFPQKRPLAPVYPPFDNLVGYWPSDNFTGTKLYDVSGNDNDADVGTASTTRVQGVSGMAIDFPGSGSGYTLLSDASAGAIEDLFYASWWINVDDVAGDAAARLFSRDVSDYWAIQLQQNEAFPQDLVIQKTPTTSVTLNDFIKTASTWYFILCQWDHTNNIFECWVGERDGDLALVHRDEALAAKGTTTRPIVFGSNTEATIGTLGPFDGTADDLRVGSGNLHKNEIEALFKFPGASNIQKITEDEITAGAVTTAKLAALAVTEAKVAANAVTTAKIAADAVTAAEIAANAVSMEQLFIASFDNLAMNPGFEQDTTLSPWSAEGTGTWSNVSTSPRSGARAAQFDPSGQSAGSQIITNGLSSTQSLHVSATEDDEFYAEVWVRKVGAGAVNTVSVELQFRDETGSIVNGVTSSAISPSQTYQKISISGVAGAGVAYVLALCIVNNTGNSELILFDDMYARRRVTGDIIVANTITANEIAALTITAAEIAALTITAAQIAANTITAAEIAANTITAAEIAALTITASEIAAGTITANEILANTITAVEIAANTITATEIAAGTITATEINAGTITGTEINGSTLSAIFANLGTVTAGTIDANVIVAATSFTATVGAFTGRLTVDTVGQTSPLLGACLTLDNSHASNPNGITILFSGDSPNDQTQLFLRGNDGSANRFHIWSDGSFDGQDGIFAGTLDVTGTSTVAKVVATASDFHILKNSPASATTEAVEIHNNKTSGQNKFVSFGTEATHTERGTIDFDRASSGLTRYNTSSDGRLKNNIADAVDALDLIRSLRVRSFGWKDMPGASVPFGFIGQEVYPIAPFAVSKGDDKAKVERQWGMDHSTFVPATVRAIQELELLVNDLQDEVTLLKAAP